MRGALARRLTAVDAQAAHDPDPASLVVVTPLGGQATHRGTEADRSCDRCRAYVAPTPPEVPPAFFIGGVSRTRRDGLRAVITFGMCRRCVDAEAMPGAPA